MGTRGGGVRVHRGCTVWMIQNVLVIAWESHSQQNDLQGENSICGFLVEMGHS